MNYRELQLNIIKSATKINTPILCEFELTSKCNFHCPMCYVHQITKNQDLTTNQWLEVFDQAIASEMLFANLTGGEVFSRPDFTELYEYLFDKGIKITIYTNGSLLNEKILNVLKKKKPHFIAITLYGHDSESYKEITKNQKGFDNVVKNIKVLKENKINLLLRTIPLRAIYNDIDKLIDLVKSLDEKLYFVTYLTKTNCFDKNNERLTAKELIDFSNKINNAFNHKPNVNEFEDDYKSCTALRSTCFINHKGDMLPCSLGYKISKNILKNDFLETFRELGVIFKEQEKNHPCFDCEFLDNCSTCYARREQEEGCSNCATYLKELSIEKSNFKYYEIAGMTFGFNYKYDKFLSDNIEKYEINYIPSNSYSIRNRYVTNIDLPDEEPDYVYSTRRLYDDGLNTAMYALKEDKVMLKYERSEDLRKTEISLNTTVEQDLAEKEYVFSGIAFLDIAAYHKKVALHGSGIIYNNEGIIFSAPSQTGKSTHTNYWIKAFNDIKIYNDDKPLIYLENNQLVTAGTPFSGKTGVNLNKVIPLKAIVFLEQGKTNILKEISDKEKLTLMMKNIHRPREEELWMRIFPVFNKIIKQIPMYKASVTNSIDSAIQIKKQLLGGNDED